MIFRSLNKNLLIRLLLLLCSAALTGWAGASGNYTLLVLTTLAIIFLVPEMMHYVNSTNRKLTFFFDAIRNEDSTLHFPEKIGDKFTRQLHTSLNRLNLLISEIKIRNEHNERFYQELLRYSSTGIIAVDEQGYIELINNAALRFLGLQNLTHLKLLQQKRKEFYEELAQLKPGQTRILKLLRQQELQQISVKVSLLQFGEKKFHVYSLYDIKAEMEENEVESWQKLIRVLTHEIMNSIAPITSLSKTLQRFLQSGEIPDTGMDRQLEKTREGLQVIEETGKGLMHFIDNYRKLTKIPKPVFKKVQINDWINRVVLLMKERFEADNIRLELNYKSQQKQFIADEKLLTQVLINILNNAIDAVQGRESPRIQVNAISDGTGKLQISVTDFGKGIPANDLDKIFIPFYTTKENGSGIGLSLSRQIMRLHKGSISINSQVNKLTTVTLKF